MATTRIISMHVSHGKTIADCLTDRIDYSKNPEKTQGGELISAYECDPKTADAEFLYSKRQYQTITGREQRHDVIAYQVRQSFKPGEITPEEANRVGYEFAERYVLPESVQQTGLEAQYREAFRQAGEAAVQLRAAGAGEDVLSYLLLSGQTVPVLTTMNAGELYVFFRLRCCNRAQWEIRDAACAALAALRKTSPLLFSLYGPSCFVSGKCPEGRMTCGRQAEIQRKFSE